MPDHIHDHGNPLSDYIRAGAELNTHHLLFFNLWRGVVDALLDQTSKAQKGGRVMTVTLFISIFTIGAAISGLLTEAVKKAYENAGRQYSANVIALIDAFVVGGLGTAVSYMLLGIPWTVNNIICLILMIVVVWVGSMIGYDKIIQLFAQLKDLKEDKADE